VDILNLINMTKEQFKSIYLDFIVIAGNNTDKSANLVVLPDNAIYMGIQIGNPITELHNSKTIALNNFGICGLLTKKKEYLCTEGSETLIIKFKPWTASQFFPDLSEFTDTNISLDNIFSKSIFENLNEQFQAANNKKDLLLEFLQQRLNKKVIDKSILHSIDMISNAKGQIRVDDLAYSVSNSKRNFERKFKATTGLTPKKFITNIRFQNSLQHLLLYDDLIDIAFSCGYYDQSHFNNEFKKITGLTPEKYMLSNLTSKVRLLPEMH
jgi:AraC-like DNA-binding protein